MFSSTHCLVLDCIAFSVDIIYPLWPPKIMENLVKTKFEKIEKQKI